MNLIESKAELIPQIYDLQGMYEQIELAGRTSYKSEGRIKLDENGRSTTAKAFTEMLEKAKHGAALEHGTVYLTIPTDAYGARQAVAFYIQNKYSECRCPDTTESCIYYVTTNYRVIVEAARKSDLKWLSEPTEFHVIRKTIRFTISRAIANEFVRHRTFSFLQESTRYVSYVDGLEAIKPYWYDSAPQDVQNVYDSGMTHSEECYKKLIEQGCKAQQARGVLPLDLKTELVMTGTAEQWKDFFNLRSSKAGAHGMHPDAAEVTDKAYDLINER